MASGGRLRHHASRPLARLIINATFATLAGMPLTEVEMEAADTVYIPQAVQYLLRAVPEALAGAPFSGDDPSLCSKSVPHSSFSARPESRSRSGPNKNASEGQQWRKDRLRETGLSYAKGLPVGVVLPHTATLDAHQSSTQQQRYLYPRLSSIHAVHPLSSYLRLALRRPLRHTLPRFTCRLSPQSQPGHTLTTISHLHDTSPVDRAISFLICTPTLPGPHSPSF